MSDESDRIKSLEGEIRKLNEENEILTESVEDVYLLGLVSERLARAQSKVAAVGEVVEALVILKELDYCAFLAHSHEGYTVLDEHALRLEHPQTGKTFDLPDNLKSCLSGDKHVYCPEGDADLPAFIRACCDEPGAFYLRPLNVGGRQYGMLLCVVCADKVRNLKASEHMLSRAAEMLELRLDSLTLVDSLKRSVKEKELIIREMHHRVKNNLSVLQSLFYLQSSLDKGKDVGEVLMEGQNRVRSMALIHEMVYLSDDLKNVNFSTYIKDLTFSLFKSYEMDTHNVELNIDVPDIFMDMDTLIPCGLILHELISNSFKYAFPDNRRGQISITVRDLDSATYSLTIADDGVGLPPDFKKKGTGSLGMKIVDALVEQLDGTLNIESQKGHTEFGIIFKERPHY